MNVTGLAHIGVFTEDINVSKKFYVDTLGFELDFETTLDKGQGHRLKVAFVKAGSMVLELLQHTDVSKMKRGSDGAVNHLAMEVSNIEAVIRDYRQKGIEFETDEPIFLPDLYNGVKVGFFSGPSGERLELFEYLKNG